MHFRTQQIHVVVEKSQHHACESLGNLKRNAHKNMMGGVLVTPILVPMQQQ